MGTNTIISGMFSQMADALITLRDNPFKIAAYRKAAKVLADYPVDVEEAYKKGGIKALTAIPGIGAALAKYRARHHRFYIFNEEGEKIAEFIDTGRIKKYEEIMSQKD